MTAGTVSTLVRWMILVDTNIVLRIAQEGHPHQSVALRAIASLKNPTDEVFAVATRSLYEFYVVCTRPGDVNGLGMSPTQGRAEVQKTAGLFQTLAEQPTLFNRWDSLVAKYSVAGKPAHDARLVAFMLEYGISRLLTFNDGDFLRYTEITALNPFDLLGLPRS
jgi:predicted nucleic acid-binding protein